MYKYILIAILGLATAMAVFKVTRRYVTVYGQFVNVAQLLTN